MEQPSDTESKVDGGDSDSNDMAVQLKANSQNEIKLEM